jgi:hypothetical protein
MDRFDNGLAVIRKLLKTATKLLVRIDKQHQTDRKLDRLLDYWAKQRSNGYRR